MRRLAALFVLALAAYLAGCSDPIPMDKIEYAGEWRARGMRLLITPGGRCEYRRQRDGGASTSISAPIQRFEGDNFVVGVGLFSTTFVVSKPPRLVEGQWKMTVDGVVLTRFNVADEVQT